MASVTVPSSAAARKRAKKKARTIPIIITLVLLAGGGVWGWVKTHGAEDPNSNLITTQVVRGDLVETVSATGSITAETGAQVKIGSQITGIIKRLYADVGSTVKAGDIIAELDLPDIAAQVHQAEATLAAAQTKYLQQQTGVSMQKIQSSRAVTQAESALRGANARLESAQASANLQVAQTPTDIRRAETSLAAVHAALSTAISNEKQVQAGANLQIANAQDQLTQMQANANNSAINLKRQRDLLTKGFVASAVVDSAEAADIVNQSLVKSAVQNVQLVKDKVAADIQSAQDAVTQAQQNVASADAALASAKAGVYSDKAREADVNDARSAVLTAQANLQIARGNLTQDVIKVQDVQQAKEAVRLAKAQLDYSRAQLAKTYIKTPISGTVLQLASQQGETLAAGLSAPTLIIVADLDRLQADVFVDETDIGKMRIGQDAEVHVDAFPGRGLKGKVTKIASGSTIQQGVVTYDVTVSIHDKKHQLKPDMTASVTIQTGTHSNVLLIPAEAVKVGAHGSTVGLLVKKDGKSVPESHKVKTGASDGVNTEVLEGLKENDTIILAGADFSKKKQQGSSSPFGPSGGGGGRRGGI